MAFSDKWDQTRYQCQLGRCWKHTRSFPSWDDLVDHLLNAHRFAIEEGRLVRR